MDSESNSRVAIIGEIIKARNEQGISQKQLEKISGVKQPIIARMETGQTNPQLNTILKILAPLGKTLAVVPLEDNTFARIESDLIASGSVERKRYNSFSEIMQEIDEEEDE
ncbi:MAG: helix-turn-helix domain-containing protein [Ruminococcus sp.]